jgi:iron-sulfur cluster insertion protein
MQVTPAITLTNKAAQKIYTLLKEEQNFELKLRVYITGGGCSGFQYGFAFEEQTQIDDLIFKTPLAQADPTIPELAIQVVVDPLSIMYLTGSEIDYLASLRGAHFAVKNPNAQTTCGCGSSFSV